MSPSAPAGEAAREAGPAATGAPAAANVGAANVGAAKVSVVMPAYKAQATLPASMASVLTQTHRRLELIVVDDCSPDATWALIETAAAADARVIPIRQPRNGGVAAARNAALEAATGSHIAFLDSDDLWRPQKLELQLARMAAGGAPVSYGAYRRFDIGGNTLSLVRPPPRTDYAGMLKSNRIGNLTGLYDRALGEFRFRRIGHEDYVFWLDVVRAAGCAERAGDEVLADYLVRPGSLSADKAKAARWQWNIYRDVAGLGRARSAWYFAHYAAIAVMKRR
jgi:glycosyltransferase involved in cell wall biosynthesis